MKKMKINVSLPIILAVCLTAGCSKESEVEKVIPKPSFTTNGAEMRGLCYLGYINESVSFDNTSKDCVSYLWDFDDGTTSTLESPKHTFTDYGVYDVKLTGTSKDSIKQSVTEYYSIDSRTIKPEIISATLVYCNI